VEIDLLGEQVVIERIGTDGDSVEATRLFAELDGQVDALGVGGIDLWVGTAERRYSLRAAHKLVRGVTRTPVVDGGGLKSTLERQSMRFVEAEIGADIQPKRAMLTVGLDRYGMSLAIVEAGYDTVFCDLMFAVGIPLAFRTLRQVNVAAFFLAPIISQLPISVLYPTGQQQHENIPKFVRWYNWATLIGGDCLYIRRHMPAKLEGKTILTNTTTEGDMEAFRQAGVRYLVTTTPRLEGRSFGTNMMEAALVAVSGRGRVLNEAELAAMIDALELRPQIERLDE
jgi:hypothetical protein